MNNRETALAALQITASKFDALKSFKEVKTYYSLIAIASILPILYSVVLLYGLRLAWSGKNLKRFIIIPNLLSFIFFALGIAVTFSLLSIFTAPSAAINSTGTIWLLTLMLSIFIFGLCFLFALGLRKNRLKKLAFEMESLLALIEEQ